jgi:hypothetical protein
MSYQTCSRPPRTLTVQQFTDAATMHSTLLVSKTESSDRTVHSLPVEILEARLKQRPPGRTPAHLAYLDIGTFPSISPGSLREIPKRPQGEKLHFLKWIHRTNNSDLALVALQNDSDLKILKIITTSTMYGRTTADCSVAQERRQLPCGKGGICSSTAV